MPVEERLRLFVAIELPEAVKDYLTRIQEQLKATLPRGVRWVRPEGIHLTLKFLGSVSSPLIPQIETAIAKGCEGGHPFSLKLSGLGAFPGKSRPRVIWVGVEGDLEALVQLQGKVDRELERLGFARENRPFAPHLTLGRVDESAPAEVRRGIGALADSVKIPPDHPFEVKSVSLMQSKLMQGGAIYHRLTSISL